MRAEQARSRGCAVFGASRVRMLNERARGGRAGTGVLPDLPRALMGLRQQTQGLMWRGSPGRRLLLIAIVLTLPLEVSKLLFPIHQFEVSRVLMMIAVAWVAIRVASGARPVPRYMALAVSANLLVIVGSFLLTRWPDGLLIALAALGYSAFMVFVADVVDDLRDVLLVGVALVVSGVYTSLIAVAQALGGFYLWREGRLDVLGRANATFGDPNVFARVLVICAVAALAILAAAGVKRRRSAVQVLCALLVIGAGISATQSRTGWALLGAALAASSVLALRQRIVGAGVGAAVLGFALWTGVGATGLTGAGTVVGQVVDVFEGSGPSGDASYNPPRDVPGRALVRALPLDGIRVYLVEAGIAMWQDHPTFGVGTGGFRNMMAGPYRDFIPRERLADVAPELPHTSLIQVAAENGWVGLGALVFLGAAIARAAARGLRDRDARVRTAVLAAAVGIAVIVVASQMAGRLFNEPYLWLVLGLLIALTRSQQIRFGRERLEPASALQDPPPPGTQAGPATA